MRPYDAAVLYDRVRRIRARRENLKDYRSILQANAEHWRQSMGQAMMANNSKRSTPRRIIVPSVVNAEQNTKSRDWRGIKGHRGPRTAKSQVVKNSQGKNVVVMSKPDRDKAIQAKFGSIHVD